MVFEVTKTESEGESLIVNVQVASSLCRVRDGLSSSPSRHGGGMTAASNRDPITEGTTRDRDVGQ